MTQLMPGTAEEMGVTDINNTRQQIFGGAKYLAKQIKKFGSIDLGLAAYNAGPGNVQKYNNEIPPFPETQDYVEKVIGNYQVLA